MFISYSTNLSSTAVGKKGLGPGLHPKETVPFTFLRSVVIGTLYWQAASLIFIPFPYSVTAEVIAFSLHNLHLGVLA